MDYRDFQTALASCADDEYRVFAMRGIPSERPFIGVRIPQIRKIVSKVPPENYADFLTVEPVALEEVLARGMIIAGGLSYTEMLKYFDSQINYIDDWCTCDMFCSALKKTIRAHRENFLAGKIEPLLKDEREFATRVGIVLLKCHYVDFDYLYLIFDRVENLAGRDEYYVKMAIAWLVAECFIKFPEQTLGFLKATKMTDWTFNKTISKICDSFRVDLEMKKYLKTLRR